VGGGTDGGRGVKKKLNAQDGKDIILLGRVAGEKVTGNGAATNLTWVEQKGKWSCESMGHGNPVGQKVEKHGASYQGLTGG